MNIMCWFRRHKWVRSGIVFRDDKLQIRFKCSRCGVIAYNTPTIPKYKRR